jgi:DNA polymerase-1
MLYLGIDGTNWVHVLYHAKGGPDGVLDAFLARIAALDAALNPGALLTCFDRPSFRPAIIPAYKGDRDERPEDLGGVLASAEKAAGSVGQVAFQDGFEADDCLATLAAHGVRCGYQVVLATPDKDLRQCLAPGVRLLTKFRVERGECTAGEWWTEKTLLEKHGLRPDQWTSFQALVGNNDNLPSAMGWGPKAAEKALEACGSLGAMLAKPDSVPCTDKQRASLREFGRIAVDVLAVVTMRTDVDAVFDALR